MKAKVTKKEVRQSFNTILSLGYCEIQGLTYYINPFAYSCGVYGWSCDYYDVKNVCLCTGYSPIGRDVPYSLVKEYETKANKVVYGNYGTPYEEKKAQVTALLNEFIDKATKKGE